MEELINQLRTLLGNRAENIFKKGPAEIEVLMEEGMDVQKITEDLKFEILKVVDENTLVKINVMDFNGNLIDSFALNQ